MSLVILDKRTGWMHTHLVNVLVPLDNRRALAHALFTPHGDGGTSTGNAAARAFAFLGPLWDDCAAVSAPNRIMGLMGFGVMESPDRWGSQSLRRIPRQGGCRATLLCALRPWLREADAATALLDRVGLLHPKPFTKKHPNT